MLRVASDTDFDEIRQQINSTGNNNGWKLEYDKNNVRIWRKENESGVQTNTFKLETIMCNCTTDFVYDTLHDHEYRKVWDVSMIRAIEIGHFDATNDLGYYAISCPKPIKNRDFVLLRSWLNAGDEKIIINRSISHPDYPPNEMFVRAYTKLTGYLIRKLDTNTCYFGYLTQCDPQGKLPIWFVNRLTRLLMPQFLKKLKSAVSGYRNWKRAQPEPDYRPWLNPEQIRSPKLEIDTDWLRVRSQPSEANEEDQTKFKTNREKPLGLHKSVK